MSAELRKCEHKNRQKETEERRGFFPLGQLFAHLSLSRLPQLLVFNVTPFKIDQNKNQSPKTLAKIQVRRKFRIREIRRNVLPKFIEICRETPCWCPPGWAPTRRTETNKNICYRVLVQKREFIPRGTHKHKQVLYSIVLYQTTSVKIWNGSKEGLSESSVLTCHIV